MKETTISAVLLTHEGAEGIAQCIQSVKWCDEIIVVVDSKSIGIPKQVRDDKKIKVYRRVLNDDFGAQRNFGLEKATGDWVLFVDVDEVVTEELKKEILAVCHLQHDTRGFYLKRRDYFLGKWLKYGETGSVRLLRLAKKAAGRWQGRVHEVWKVESAAGELENPILHYPHESITYFLGKINHYTDLVAQYWKEEGRVVHVWEIIVYPFGKFIQNYILRFGFLDGIQGLILALMMSFHSFLSRSKYWLATQK